MLRQIRYCKSYSDGRSLRDEYIPEKGCVSKGTFSKLANVSGKGPKSGDSGTERIARLCTKKSRVNPFNGVRDVVPGSHVLDAGKACDTVTKPCATHKPFARVDYCAPPP